MFGDNDPRVLRWLVTLSLVGTLVLMGAATYSVALGGWMSCGADFPKCAGVYAPIFHSAAVLSSQYTAAQILAEWFHRATAFVTGLLMLTAMIFAWWRVEGFGGTRWVITLATAVLPFEAYLGVLTGVPNPSIVLVTIHLFVSLFVLLALALASLVLWRSAGKRRRSPGGQTA